ncbi:M28 family peptidase [Arenibacter sp. 6A1]|uniref:M28 family metallopeptidase n=1 Tax=Arenibacter sp. 6A1 TaxID=2720391 RepID=UPI001445BC0A|nr:M28 family peptidase [Arenibacter sp. 6A1]NKI28150.1 M28 family peptidase [Arenibacter sp. 6A1]
MKGIFKSLLLLLLIASCGVHNTNEVALKKSTPTTGSAQGDQITTVEKYLEAPLAFSKKERVGEILGYLASDELEGREAGSEGIDKAAAYIEDLFKNYGIAPFFTSYRDTLANFEKTTFNMVGYIEGTDENLKNEYVIIGAHYDHIGRIAGVAGDDIANGANDNGSGTTAVLEFARYFGHTKANKRSVIFALFSAEEQGLLGSKHLADRLKEQELDLYTMLNFEMVGVPLVNKDYMMYVTGYENSNLAEVFNAYGKDKLVGFLPTAKEYNLFKRSDNYPFHETFGVPSQTFCTFDFTNFDHYHKVGDEVSAIDMEHMSLLVNRTIPVLEKIINAPTKEISYK